MAVRLTDKILPLNDGFVGMVDASQVIGGVGNTLPTAAETDPLSLHLSADENQTVLQMPYFQGGLRGRIYDNEAIPSLAIDTSLRQLVSGGTTTFDWASLKFPTLTTNGLLQTSGDDGSISVLSPIPYLTEEFDPVFSSWLILTPPLYSETDPLSLHLDQTSPQTMTGVLSGTGLFKLTAGVVGLDTNTYLTAEADTLATVTARGNSTAQSVLIGATGTPSDVVDVHTTGSGGVTVDAIVAGSQDLIDRTAGSIITNTGTGRAANAFDGVTNQVAAGGSGSAYVVAADFFYMGKDWGAGNTKTLTGFKCYASSDVGFVNSSNPTVTAYLQGSDVGRIYEAGDWTTLASASATDANGLLLSVLTGLPATPYRYHRVKLDWGGASDNIYIAEVQFYEGSGAASALPSVILKVNGVQTAKVWTDGAASNAVKVDVGSTTRLAITTAGQVQLVADNQELAFGAAQDFIIKYDGTNAIINPKAVGTGFLSILGDISLLDEDIILGTTTGTKIGTATNQKLGFFNATPIVQVANTTDLGVVLSNLGLRAAGTAYPITTTGLVSLNNTTTALQIGAGAAGVDYRILFDGENNDGILTWMEDEDYFKFADNVNIDTLTASKVVFTSASKTLTSTGIGTSSQFIKGDGSLDSTTYVSGTPWTALGYITDLDGALAAESITPVANGTYTVGKGVIQDGTITVNKGIITAIVEVM